MIDPKDKKKLLEENHYLDSSEADLIDDEQYIEMMATAFEEAAGDMSDVDEDIAMRQIYEDSILAEFGYIDPKDEEDEN